MSDTDELLREVEKHTGGEQSRSQSEPTEAVEPSQGASRSGDLRSRAASRAVSVFSPKSFLVAAALAAVGLFVAGSIPILSSLPVVGQLSRLLGVFVGTFAYGAVGGESRYLEAGAAGGAIAGVAALSNFLAWTLVGVGVPIVAVLAALGVVAGLLGHYFGRDLRAGITADL